MKEIMLLIIMAEMIIATCVLIVQHKKLEEVGKNIDIIDNGIRMLGKDFKEHLTIYHNKNRG